MPDDRVWTEVDQYFADRLLREDTALDRALITSAAAGLPGISVSPLLGAMLAILARSVRARSILEIGTLGGYSTLCMAQALPGDGRIVSLEIDPKHAEVARGNIASAGFADIVDVRLGRALDLLPAIEAAGEAPFDMVFIDADKGGNADYFEWSLKLTRPGSLILVDNVVRGGAVANPKSRDSSVLGVHRLTDRIAGDPRVQATAIQTVGVKGYDGLLMAVVL